MTEKKQRTIQVKIGNQAARAMTPDQAADYLKNIAGKGWGNNRELKMTFDNGSTSTVSLPRTGGEPPRSTTTRSDGMPCSEKEMKALMSMFVEIMGLQMNTERLNQVKSTTKQRGSFQFPSDLPPPPGGWPEDLMWPEDDNEVDSLPDLEDIPPEEHDLMLQHAKEMAMARMSKKKRHDPDARFPPVPGSKEAPVDVNAPVTGIAGIAPFEWSALERAAIEDALEQEERIRKESSPNKDKKKNAKKSATSNAQEAAIALKKVEAANKKLGKAVATWRSRVAAAVTQNEVHKLEALLSESPLPAVANLQQQAASALTTKQQETSSLNVNSNPHLEFLVPLTVPKNRSVSKNETRVILAKYLLSEFSASCMFSIGRNGRSAVHTACFYDDLECLELILEQARKSLTKEQLKARLVDPCQDSGWTPLHYATVSGSLRIIESLFKACANDPIKLCRAETTDTHTWKKGTNKGVTANFLADALVSGKCDKMIESLGMALQEVIGHCTENSVFIQQTEAIYHRLLQIDESGYIPLSEKVLCKRESEWKKQAESQQRKSLVSVESPTFGTAPEVEPSKAESRPPDAHGTDEEPDSTTKAAKKSKKKKKKKKGSASSEASKDINTSAPDKSEKDAKSSSNESWSVANEDPLVSALTGMGFDYDQVMEGIEACGGMSRATADDVVAWIVGGAEPDTTEAEDSTTKASEPKLPAIPVEEAQRRNREAARRMEEEARAAERLAAKREEQRRRNREWNSKAQVRQTQEAQMKLVQANRAQGVLKTGLPPASNFLSGVRGPSPTFGTPQNVSSNAVKLTPDSNGNRKTVRLVGGLNVSASALDSGIDNVLSNDASTIASSLEHIEVEIRENDDATVSTMGSFPAIPTPAPASFAPPGFSDGQMPSHHWESQRSASSDMYGNGSSFVPLSSAHMNPPPGIPESGPLLEHLHPQSNLRSHSFSGSASSRLPGTAFACSGNGSLGVGVAAHGTAHRSSSDLGSSLNGFASLPPRSSAGMERPTPALCNVLSSTPPPVPGLLGFGSDASQRPRLESALIDSISTGNATIGGSSLWGEPASAGGSSLLGNLINAAQHSAQTESLFSSSSSFGEQNPVGPNWRRQNQNAMQNSGGGQGSIW